MTGIGFVRYPKEAKWTSCPSSLQLRFLTFIPWLFLRQGLGSCTIPCRDTLIVVVPVLL